MTTVPPAGADEATGFHLEPRTAKRFLVYSTGLWQGDKPFRFWALLIGFTAAVIASIIATDLIKNGCKLLFDGLTEGNTSGLIPAAITLALVIAVGCGIALLVVRTHNEQARAWALTFGLGASLLFSTGATVALAAWNKWFFDALERKDVATVKFTVMMFPIIIISMAAIGVCIILTRETLQVRWREWFVKRLLGKWLTDGRFHRIQTAGIEPPAPEYRISDDTRWATEILVDLGIGLFSALVGGLTFVFILWSVGGSFKIGGFDVPGYMVWLALLYGITASTLMAWIGKPLVGRVGNKNEAEGHFRFAMMNVRGHARDIAANGTAPEHAARIHGLYENVVTRWLRVVKSHGHITWIMNATGPMIPVIPLLFAAPKYLAGDLTLGQVTQLAFAFHQVQSAISWVVDNYSRIAEWYASARRVMDVIDACDAVDAPVAVVEATAAPRATPVPLTT